MNSSACPFAILGGGLQVVIKHSGGHRDRAACSASSLSILPTESFQERKKATWLKPVVGGALSFELAQGHRVVPVDGQVLPSVAAELREARSEKWILPEIVDSHSVHFSSETPPRKFSWRARTKRKSDKRLRKTSPFAPTTSLCDRRTTSRSARRQTARAR